MKRKVSVNKIIQNIVSGNRKYADEICDWLSESDDNRKIYQNFFELWQITGSFPESFVPHRKAAWQNVRKHIYSRKKKLLFYREIIKIAAMIVVVISCIGIGTKLGNFKKPCYSEIIALSGHKTKVILPDSSVVMLNGGSVLKYNLNFNEDNRIVELQGEGYFDVRKDLSNRFIVRTSELSVKVFGTAFNVKAYSDDVNVEVGLKRGNIEIDRNKKKIVHLIPGEVAIFNKNAKELKISKMDVNLISAWTRNELIFDEDSLSEVIKSMERWYGVDINVAPELIDGERYTFKVKTESLRELLKLINLLNPINYKINGKEVLITKP